MKICIYPKQSMCHFSQQYAGFGSSTESKQRRREPNLHIQKMIEAVDVLFYKTLHLHSNERKHSLRVGCCKIPGVRTYYYFLKYTDGVQCSFHWICQTCFTSLV